MMLLVELRPGMPGVHHTLLARRLQLRNDVEKRIKRRKNDTIVVACAGATLHPTWAICAARSPYRHSCWMRARSASRIRWRVTMAELLLLLMAEPKLAALTLLKQYH